MGFFVSLLGLVVKDTAVGVATGTVAVAGAACRAIDQGIDDFKELARDALADYFKKPRIDGASDIEKYRQQLEARRLGISVEELRVLTPERRQQLEALLIVKQDIDTLISILENEIKKLRASIFHAVYTKKIVIKQIKLGELQALKNSRNWDEFRARTCDALANKQDVTVGRHSRTKALLMRIMRIVGDPPISAPGIHPSTHANIR